MNNMPMHQSLTLGNMTFASNLVQGPLAGYTCAPMRAQTWKFSNPGYCSTEMVSATHLIHAKQPPPRYTERDPSEGPLCFQLSASNPENLARATTVVNQIGAEVVELNCGCPVNKIRRKGAGSRLLSQPDHLTRMITALRTHTDAVVSIKIRVSGDSDDQHDLELAQLIEQAGADCLVVHGRHWTERYDVPCRYEQIARLVQAVSIPVIGNGDVEDKASLERMLKTTGCAGVMIARASMGQPWLFRQLTDPTFTLPAAEVIGATYIEHIEGLAQLDNPFRAVLQARKMGKYYARDHLADKSVFLAELMECEDLTAFRCLVTDHFRTNQTDLSTLK